MQAHTDAAHGPAAENTVFTYFAEFPVEWGGIREIIELVNGPFHPEAYTGAFGVWTRSRAEALLAGHAAAIVHRRIIKLNQRVLKWQRILRRVQKLVLKAHTQRDKAESRVTKCRMNQRRATRKINNMKIEIMELQQEF